VSELLGARVDIGNGRVMVDGPCVHRANDRDLIGNAGGVRQKIGIHLGSSFANLLEVEHRSDTGKGRLAAGHASDALAIANRIGKFRSV